MKTGVDIGFVDRNGCNALHIASAAGFVDIVEMILLYWSKQKVKNKKFPQELRDVNSSTDSKGFEIDCVDNLQTTSLMKASINSHVRIVELLLRFGASPKLTNNRGENALTLACMQENYAICERLLIAKGDVNYKDMNGRTPLLKAAQYNSNSKILELLLKYGANPEIADSDGNTPLHFSAIRGTKDVAIFLIKLGANPYARNNVGNIPVEEVTNELVAHHFQVCLVCKKQAPVICNHCNVVRYCNIEC